MADKPVAQDDSTEQAISQAGADVAPRVKSADVQASIVEEHYFTARDGCEGACGGGGTYPVGLGLLTFCVLTLRNGFTVTGESACASPENFNADIGRRIARENAVAKIWPLMGYELRTKLATARF
ncbi:MAG: Gp49 family protein [Hydrogenophaga sp.]|nr:Gp49 family protein [Hydrogenophaga sp.]